MAMKFTRIQLRDRQLKKVGRVNIIPHIILTVLFIAFLQAVNTAFMSFFESYVLVNKLDQKRVEATALKDTINSFSSIDEVKNNESLIDRFGDFIIVDDKNKVYLNTSGVEFNPEKYMVQKLFNDFSIAIEKNTRIITETDDINLGQLGISSSGTVRVFINGEDFGNLIMNKSFSEPVMEVENWLVNDLDNGYLIFSPSNVNLTLVDILYFLGLLVLSGTIAFIPFVLYLVTLISGIVRQKKSANAMFMDSITGARNWLFFRFAAEKILKKNLRRKKKSYVIANIRMDRFSSYSMCYGADEGKALIELMSGAIIKRDRKAVFARYAEAEYVFLLPYISDAQTISEVENIVKTMKACAGERKIDFSAGLCMTGDEIDVDKINNNAVNARKTISSDSLIRVSWFNEELKEAQIWERFVEEHMEQALKNGEFKVYVQPKYKAAERVIGGAEALIRWISPTEGFIGPGKFIPIFEKNGFITQIDDFMISEVSKLQAKWISEGKNVVPVSVNVSRAHFTRDDLAEHICGLVEAAGAPKDVIELELTESAFFQDRDVLINTVQKLRDYGFKVSMDDFGADYSSLNSLKDMPLDVIKLDAGFFRGKESSAERGSVIVAGVIDMAKNLGMHIVAEGIEEAGQVDFLAEHGCDLIQGFYFAKPMPAEEYEKEI